MEATVAFIRVIWEYFQLAPRFVSLKFENFSVQASTDIVLRVKGKSESCGVF